METVDHFLACPHPIHQLLIWKELHKSLFQHQLKNAVSNIFHDILHTAYTKAGKPQLHHLPANLNDMYLTQARLGWKQLYYGRFTPLWYTLLQKHHPQVNGNNCYTKILQLIWQATLKIWKMQNAKQSSTPRNPKQDDCSQLQAAVNQILYHEAQAMGPTVIGFG